MDTNKKFSIRARKESFNYAFEGLFAMFRSEHNMWIHLLATVVVIILAVVLKVSIAEFALLFLAMGMVWVAEIFNTVIERIIDFVSTERKPAIKQIKDFSAAAVLVAAIIALIVGCFVFIPKF